MADDDAEIIVSLETEGEVTKTTPDRDAEGKFVGKTEVEPAEDLAAQFKEEADRAKERATAAERQAALDRQAADQARREAATARTEASESQLDTVSTGLAAAQGEAEAATAAYQSAMEAGDFAAAAKAQRRMAAAEAKIGRLDEAKSDLEARKVERPAERTEVERRQPLADPVEEFISHRSPDTAAWLRNHQDHARALAKFGAGTATDAEKKLALKLNAADADARAEGFVQDSAGYFKHVEQFIGLTKVEAEKAKSNVGPPFTQASKRRATVPVAPVHQSGGGTNGGGTEVRLSAGEARAATDGTLVWNYDDPSPQKRFKKGDVLGVQELARRKVALQAQGAYDRTFTES